ncbi:MAG: serine/threonine protein kinase, partial [Planctomycetaceae bacterium]|nr:serine/threonine protein kinase [Planctomycetaceae bacterium]
GKEGPNLGGPPRFGGPNRGGGPNSPRHDEPQFDGTPADGPPRHGFHDGDRGRMRFDTARSASVQNTEKHILDILTPQQRAKWDELIGEPFEG